MRMSNIEFLFKNYEKKKSLYAMSFCIEYGTQCMGTST